MIAELKDNKGPNVLPNSGENSPNGEPQTESHLIQNRIVRITDLTVYEKIKDSENTFKIPIPKTNDYLIVELIPLSNNYYKVEYLSDSNDPQFK